MGFDVQLAGNEKRLAAALALGFVALFRIEAELVEKLSIVAQSGARTPLFVGDYLLVMSLNEYRNH